MVYSEIIKRFQGYYHRVSKKFFYLYGYHPDYFGTCGVIK